MKSLLGYDPGKQATPQDENAASSAPAGDAESAIGLTACRPPPLDRSLSPCSVAALPATPLPQSRPAAQRLVLDGLLALRAVRLHGLAPVARQWPTVCLQ